MSELRAGGLALIVKTYSIHDNLGRSVIVDGIIPNDKKFRSPKTNSLCENSSGEDLYMVSGDVKNPFNGEDGWGLFGKEQLMPIDGEDFSHEDERQKELING